VSTFVSTAAKLGLIGRTNFAALELANDEIAANLICPSWVLTMLVQNQIEGHGHDENKTVRAIVHKWFADKQAAVGSWTPGASDRLAVPL
jgi:NAD(P)-dependent dehydrogenase (short-subunit alcohol dehydrogenase family)